MFPVCLSINMCSKTSLSRGVIGAGKVLELNQVLEITKGHVLVIKTDTILELVRDRPVARNIDARHNKVLLYYILLSDYEIIFCVHRLVFKLNISTANQVYNCLSCRKTLQLFFEFTFYSNFFF